MTDIAECPSVATWIQNAEAQRAAVDAAEMDFFRELRSREGLALDQEAREPDRSRPSMDAGTLGSMSAIGAGVFAPMTREAAAPSSTVSVEHGWQKSGGAEIAKE